MGLGASTGWEEGEPGTLSVLGFLELAWVARLAMWTSSEPCSLRKASRSTGSSGQDSERGPQALATVESGLSSLLSLAEKARRRLRPICVPSSVARGSGTFPAGQRVVIGTATQSMPCVLKGI